MAKELLINVSPGEEVRIALMEDERLEELYMERESSATHVGNIYKGKVTNVEASIQAAFVDFGIGRNGFLHVQDLHPQYMGKAGHDIKETVGNKLGRRDRPPIQQCLRRGDEILVQIIKEGIGTKGPTLTSYLSIPGRFLVMMPGVGKMGVSQKIEDDTERRRLRAIIDTLSPPKDLGFIIRTAGVGKTKAELERDFKYLVRLWEDIDKKDQKSRPPALLYTEGDLVTRTVRDVYTSDIDRIVVDDVDTAKRIKEFFKLSMPRTKNRVDVYEDHVPLFHKYGIEHEIEQMYAREVPLKSGGSLVIDQTEAVVAIDVNSGKFRVHNDAEETAFRTDLEAAEEIVRQLRLRDLGGVVICDFIDLRYERHRHALHEKLDGLFKNDRAKARFLPMSQFGIIEMTRQRMRPSLKKSVYAECPGCHGSGLVKTPESMGLDIMRRLAIAADDERVIRVELAAHPDVATDLLNRKRRAVADLETRTNKRIIIRVESVLALDELKLELFDERDGLVFLDELGMTPQSRDDRFHRGGRTRGGRGREQPRETEFRLEDEESFEEEPARGGGGGGEGRGGGRAAVAERPPLRKPRDQQARDQQARDQQPDEDRPEPGNEAVPQDRQRDEPSNGEGEGEGTGGGRRRRRRRRGRGRGGSSDAAPAEQRQPEPADEDRQPRDEGHDDESQPAVVEVAHGPDEREEPAEDEYHPLPSRVGSASSDLAPDRAWDSPEQVADEGAAVTPTAEAKPSEADASDQPSDESDESDEGKPRRRRRRRGGRRHRRRGQGNGDSNAEQSAGEGDSDPDLETESADAEPASFERGIAEVPPTPPAEERAEAPPADVPFDDLPTEEEPAEPEPQTDVLTPAEQPDEADEATEEPPAKPKRAPRKRAAAKKPAAKKPVAKAPAKKAAPQKAHAKCTPMTSCSAPSARKPPKSWKTS